MPCAQCADLALYVRVASERAQPVVRLVEGVLLGGGIVCIDLHCRTVANDFDGLGAGDGALQRLPPQPAGAFGEIAGDIDRERRVVFAHHGECVVAVVAIAVVEGEAGEAAREVALNHPAMRFIHRYDIDVERADMRQHLAQEIGRDFEMTVGLEQAAARRANVMQHEDGADARQGSAAAHGARR